MIGMDRTIGYALTGVFHVFLVPSHMLGGLNPNEFQACIAGMSPYVAVRVERMLPGTCLRALLPIGSSLLSLLS